MVWGFSATTLIRAMATSALLVAVAGCSNGSVRYAEVFDLQNQQWPSSGSIIFDYCNPQQTVEQRSQIWITARIDKGFTSNQLMLEIKTVKPDKSYWCDTIVMNAKQAFAESTRRLTTGVEQRVLYCSDAQFSQVGKWSFSIRQLNTTQDTLYGIRAVAIELRNQ